MPFDEKDRYRSAMFEDSNRIKFERPVDDLGRQWWIENFFEPFELTPENMADLLTKSIATEKSVLCHYIDGRQQSFSVRVSGDLFTGEGFWFAHRSLELKGRIFNAEEMFISPEGRQTGTGRRLMSDLIDLAVKVGIDQIRLEARNIGQYAWLRMGFLPDRGSWRHMQQELPRFVQRHEATLGRETTAEIIRQILTGGPETARLLASLDVEVPSLDRFAPNGHPEIVPLGKAMFLETNAYWSGSFDVNNEVSRRLARDYIESRSEV